MTHARTIFFRFASAKVRLFLFPAKHFLVFFQKFHFVPFPYLIFYMKGGDTLSPQEERVVFAGRTCCVGKKNTLSLQEEHVVFLLASGDEVLAHFSVLMTDDIEALLGTRETLAIDGIDGFWLD